MAFFDEKTENHPPPRPWKISFPSLTLWHGDALSFYPQEKRHPNVNPSGLSQTPSHKELRALHTQPGASAE